MDSSWGVAVWGRGGLGLRGRSFSAAPWPETSELGIGWKTGTDLWEAPVQGMARMEQRDRGAKQSDRVPEKARCPGLH